MDNLILFRSILAVLMLVCIVGYFKTDKAPWLLPLWLMTGGWALLGLG